jgi:glutaredoxin
VKRSAADLDEMLELSGGERTVPVIVLGGDPEGDAGRAVEVGYEGRG